MVLNYPVFISSLICHSIFVSGTDPSYGKKPLPIQRNDITPGMEPSPDAGQTPHNQIGMVLWYHPVHKKGPSLLLTLLCQINVFSQRPRRRCLRTTGARCPRHKH